MPGICLDAIPRQITQASETGAVPGNSIFSGPGVSSGGVFNPVSTGAGNFAVQYLYTSTAGCKDSATQSITVWPQPTARWGFSNPTCETGAITFTDSSLANFSNLTLWNWDFKDGTTSNLNSGAPFNKTFAAAGMYNVSLQVVTDSGCKSQVITKPIDVHPLPRVDFSLPIVCLPAGAAQFFDSSKIADGTESQFNYVWDFGDPANPTTSNNKNPVHNYSSQGPFAVKLTVTSVDGCSATATKQLTTVFQPPIADFTSAPPEACLGTTFVFTDNSTGTSGNITRWSWSFGDGTTSISQNASRKYTTANTYGVALTVENDKGCLSATTTKNVIVHSFPVVNAGPDLMVLEGGSAILDATASGNNLSFNWTPSTYLDNPNLKTPRTTPVSDITYNLTVTAQGGCSRSDEVFVKVLKAPTIPSAFSPNGDGINDVWNIKYLESYPGSTVEIFDRYGQLVFKSNGYSKAWDGTSNGSVLPVGTYYYIINPKNGRNPYSGSVTILR
jgi:gliding motility-associated-like protein